MPGCDQCGFDHDKMTRADIGGRVVGAAGRIAERIQRVTTVSSRPASDRWSALEYAAHVRDVLITIRDRLVIGLVENNPGFKPMYRDERVTLGLYASDTPALVAVELTAAATMLVRLFDAIDPDALDRAVQYGFPDPDPRTLMWMGAQAVHESEHHLLDIQHNAELLG